MNTRARRHPELMAIPGRDPRASANNASDSLRRKSKAQQAHVTGPEPVNCATTASAAVADMANLPHESRRRAGSIDFFTVPTVTGRVVRSSSCSTTAGGSCTSTSQSIRQRSGRRSRWLRRFLMTRRLADVARSRRDLRRGVPPASRWHGYRRGPLGSVQSLAEPVRGEADWIRQTRLPESHRGIRRATLAPSPDRLFSYYQGSRTHRHVTGFTLSGFRERWIVFERLAPPK